MAAGQACSRTSGQTGRRTGCNGLLHMTCTQWSPSQLIEDLNQPTLHAEGHRPKPQVLQLLNIADHTHQVQQLCTAMLQGKSEMLDAEAAVDQDM